MTELPSKTRKDYWVHAENPNPLNDWTERSGKWLIFTSFARIDETWKIISRETISGRLGISAKAATSKPNALSKNPWIKLICVYTYDFSDVQDVMRVRQRLREIGFTKKLSYKTDQDTEARIYSDNSQQPISMYYD